MASFYKIDQLPVIIENISQMVKTSEIEVTVNRLQGITVNEYMALVKHLITLSENGKHTLLNETTLDVNYNYDNVTNSTYRITINGVDKINKVMSSLAIRKNHSIFSILVNNILKSGKTDNDLTLMDKVKNKSKVIDIKEYDIRIRIADELPVSSEKMEELIRLQEIERHKIMFRYKERLSLIIPIDKNYDIRVDLTDIKDGKTINNLAGNSSKYELELEIIKKNNTTLKTKEAEVVANALFEYIHQMHTLLHKSKRIITTTVRNEVLKTMKRLMYGNENNNAKDLPAMQSESLENQHVAGELTTNYTVTDKADGEREFMLIMNGKIYLISNNLMVHEIESGHYTRIDEYNGSIIDGEYVWIEKYKKYLYLAFDMVMYKNADLRRDSMLINRLTKLNEVLTNVFGVKSVSILQETKSFSLDEIKTKYTKSIISMFDEMNSKLMTEPIVIMGKLFFFTSGLYQSELYLYSTLIWNTYVSDSKAKCPYTLDGMIYTPTNQIYTRDATDIRFKIYKWKPSSHNSIDFYIQFEKNPDTQQLLNAYDNSIGIVMDDNLEGNELEEQLNTDVNAGDYRMGDKLYRICNLYVGSKKTGIEQPVLFGKDNNLYLAYLYLQDGEVRDIEGNIIQDNTVVEFAYNNNPSIEHSYRWVPLRTRFDKTESVNKYKRKYGNNEMVANKVWRSITNPFEITDIMLLADEKTFTEHMQVVTQKVTKETIIAERRENSYYQLKTDLAMPMRNFHNFLKSNYIYTYCGEKTLKTGSKRLFVLDVGCGRGGDVQKFFHSRVSGLVGIDPDAEGINSPADGAISRYQTYKRKMPNMPKYIYIIADAGAELNADSQENAIGIHSDSNRQALADVFGKDATSGKYEQFDVFNCQFMLHYLFKTEQTWKNFCSNVNKYLREDGYILITVTDGKRLDSDFNANSGVVSHYYTDNGKKKLLFEYRKLYTDTDIKKPGLAVDFHTAMFMAPDVYQKEYIVDPSYLENELWKNCHCKLIETDSFENQFNLYRNFFDNVAPYEAVSKTKEYFMKAKEFYNFDNEMNRSSFELTKLNRYFIFQKMR
jgi:SAM-dependent methyltransferase